MAPLSEGRRVREERSGQPTNECQGTPAAVQDRLRYCFKKLLIGRTHGAIADHLGIPRTTVTKWFSSPPTFPSTNHVLRLAEQANISPSWLLLGVGPMLCAPREGRED